VRALLIVNPRATSTTQVRRDVIAHALASQAELDVVETRYRGHAAALAAAAVADGHRLLFTLGGDGTVNEAVNGLVGGPRACTGARTASELPALAALPGGHANVFTRALGLPTDPIDATGRILDALRCGRYRDIGLGLAGDRYFIVNADFGFGAEVVRAVEGLRARGRPITPRLYLRTALHQFYTGTDRRKSALTLERPGQPTIGGVFFGIVSNTSPWTYLGRRPVNPSPGADFDTGLDLFAVSRMGTVGTLNALRQMFAARDQPPDGRHVLSLHDEHEFTLSSGRPMALQVDGEYVGEQEAVQFRSVPHALRVIV
jgi:diacylglycerol kinase family enzyme